ncbi:hypothetical protein Dfer_0634 [Dyadobacter fermentans DSM 18053]|uniref:DUF4932 domain-containing protein n=1 Tax=Dyadobacter fermentans (strain ATCC 700827 / DSM 18053 / CIP 107007 / KCTC 52180 / NS114) TaxID=471854 RepID=C6W0G3_DYAFD|nr:hypothetical protein Dfer_0634 [Dyadobacter fermentans DSM 18053]
MFKPLLLLLAICFPPLVSIANPFHRHVHVAFADSTDGQFVVKVNANIELLGFVYFLGYEGAQSETPSYPDKDRKRYAYGLSLYQQYKSFAGSQNLAVAIGFAQDIWLDYFINLLIQLEDFPNAKLTEDIDPAYYLRFSPKGDLEEAKKNAAAFIRAMNGLYTEVDFSFYLSKSKTLYANALAQVQAGLPDKRILPAMEGFYQGHFDSYNLIPSLTIPAGMGFGAKYQKANRHHAFHVFGTFAIQQWTDPARLDMGFADKKHLLELSTHEFGHSFANPAVDRLPETLIQETQPLFEPIKEAMSPQGYPVWKTCLYEHFVRAGEVVIARKMGNPEDAKRLRDHYVFNRKFIYLDTLVTVLDQYSASGNGTYQQAVTNAMLRLRGQVTR